MAIRAPDGANKEYIYKEREHIRLEEEKRLDLPLRTCCLLLWRSAPEKSTMYTIGIAHISPTALHTLHDGQIAHCLSDNITIARKTAHIASFPPALPPAVLHKPIVSFPFHGAISVDCRIQFRIKINVMKI